MRTRWRAGMKRSIAAWLERRRGAETAPALCELPQPLPWQEARRVLVLAPHPDDECIGCGGLIVRLTQAGVPVRVVLVTDGSGAGGLPPEAAAMRQQEFGAALRRLGVTDHRGLGFPDGGLAPAPALFDAVASEVRAFMPNWVVGPSSADAHRDHRCVADAVRRAAWGCPSVERVLEYEIWGPLPATHVLDITEQLEVKRAALAEHATALAQMDYGEACIGMARYRGLLLPAPRPGAAAEAYLCTGRGTRFGWPPGWGRPEWWRERPRA